MITYRMILLFTHTKFNNPGTKLGVGTDVVHWTAPEGPKFCFCNMPINLKPQKCT